MKPSLRFLSLVVFGWFGVRAASLGLIPGAEVLRVDSGMAQPSPPPLVPTQFPPLEPPPELASAPWAEPAFEAPAAPAYGSAAYAPQPHSRSHSSRLPAPAAAVWELPDRLPGQPPRPLRQNSADRPQFFAPLPRLADWTLIPAAASQPVRQSSIAAPARSMPAFIAPQEPKLDRLQLTAWAMVRGSGTAIGTPSIASGGTLGGSQAGARLTYNFDRQLGATARLSNEIGRRGGEAALGVRVRPLARIPLWANLERRQRIGESGRNAFALFFEGGVYDRPLPWRLSFDAYFQGGVVGLRRRDGFVDGAVTVTRPVYRNLSAGLGLWGGAQPQASRIDGGPRMSYRVRDNVRMHLDYRYRFAGNAEPGSGPVMTLAADF